jgi:shikimate kinase
MAFVILIGASGSGKTAIACTIASLYSRDVQVFHFDHIGVPSAQQMIAEYGSGEAWQRAKTLEWIAKLASVVPATSGVLFEGQTRPSFLAEAAEAMGNIKYTVILIDCDDRTRARRLSHDRQQPELITDDMMNWAQYLRREAQAHGYEILDTSALPLHESVAYVLARLRQNDALPVVSSGGTNRQF